MEAIRIHRAKPSDHTEITDLTILSKAYWDYTSEQLAGWKDMLTITQEYICTNSVYKAVLNGSIIGYYSWIQQSPDKIELDNMFVHPGHIRMGIGNLLMMHFLENIEIKCPGEILLYSDPHAEPFYKKFGFDIVGKSESNIKGRYLPIMKLIIRSP